jgi:hypothetical protein
MIFVVDPPKQDAVPPTVPGHPCRSVEDALLVLLEVPHHVTKIRRRLVVEDEPICRTQAVDVAEVVNPVDIEIELLLYQRRLRQRQELDPSLQDAPRISRASRHHDDPGLVGHRAVPEPVLCLLMHSAPDELPRLLRHPDSIELPPPPLPLACLPGLELRCRDKNRPRRGVLDNLNLHLPASTGITFQRRCPLPQGLSTFPPKTLPR